MSNPRQRPIFLAVAALVVIWVVAIAGYQIARHAKVTPDKVRAYAESVDFGHLSAAERAAAIQKLAAMLNALTLEERQNLRLDRTAYKWFDKMTEAEKGEFLEATMPTGFKQMLAAFEEMPPDKRQRVVDQAVKQMKDAREKMAAGGQMPPPGTNSMVLSPELQDKVMKIGLQSFYSQSSAQTKAELAPLLEEMQRMMESGGCCAGRATMKFPCAQAKPPRRFTLVELLVVIAIIAHSRRAAAARAGPRQGIRPRHGLPEQPASGRHRAANLCAGEQQQDAGHARRPDGPGGRRHQHFSRHRQGARRATRQHQRAALSLGLGSNFSS